MEDASVDVLSSEYIKIRLEREQLREEYESQDRGLEEKMKDIENKLLDIMNTTSTDSMSTATATIIRRVSKRYNPSDWDAVYRLVDKYKAYGLLHKRIHDTNMSQFLEEHPDDYPEGLNVDSRYAVTVKRKSS
jgi:hypothetical protein